MAEPRMRIVSWNVNSLNVRLPHVLDFLQQYQPDVLALQETKLTDDKFPEADLKAAGYQVVYCGQKTYNGVAIISRLPAEDIVTALPGLDDPQRRLLAATINGVRVINVYIPNGQQVGCDKFAYKIRWLTALQAFVREQLQQYGALVLLGDFNIAPADIDIHDPVRWRDKIMCSTREREHFRQLLDMGLQDAVRQLHPDAGMYSWWDYRMNAFRRGWGLRIDHVLLSTELWPLAAGVADAFRALERPSDHAPVWVDIQ